MARRMRKSDQIRVLENRLAHEQGLWKKVCSENEHLRRASREIQMAVDAVLIAVAKRYGEKREEDGQLLGFRLPVDRADMAERDNWEIRLQDNPETGERVIGVFPREEQTGKTN